MQWVVRAYDGDDAGALDRRMKVRPAHMQSARLMKEKGEIVVGGAILDDGGRMIGSLLVVEFPSRSDLDAWLAAEPYVTGDVWRRIEVQPFRSAF
jgi:uncharacterized protein YciI